MIKFFMILVMFFLFFSLNKNLNADEIIDNNTKTIAKIKARNIFAEVKTKVSEG